MTNPLSDLLAEKGFLLADGATGTNLFNMGLMSGEPPEFWNTDKPENITKLYRGAGRGWGLRHRCRRSETKKHPERR